MNMQRWYLCEIHTCHFTHLGIADLNRLLHIFNLIFLYVKTLMHNTNGVTKQIWVQLKDVQMLQLIFVKCLAKTNMKLVPYRFLLAHIDLQFDRFHLIFMLTTSFKYYFDILIHLAPLVGSGGSKQKRVITPLTCWTTWTPQCTLNFIQCEQNSRTWGQRSDSLEVEPCKHLETKPLIWSVLLMLPQCIEKVCRVTTWPHLFKFARLKGFTCE